MDLNSCSIPQVADRCGMDPSSLGELKKTIAKALQDFVDIESEESIEVWD